MKALEDRPRAPKNHPYKVRAEVSDIIIELGYKHPNWGAKKLRVVFERQNPNKKAPVVSTISEIIKRAGLVKNRRRRVRSSRQKTPFEPISEPNSTWCADFKGQFWTGKEKCYPLIITDAHSRFIIACEGLKRPIHELSKRVFEKAFHKYGLPKRIRTDNETPFSSLAPGGLSKLSIWWMKLGIIPERIQPGHPEQNGQHERMHKTLKLETANPPQKCMRKQQKNSMNSLMSLITIDLMKPLG